mmetsp:Transcript_86971/g.251216  ORF Transcript_86971/g.251216 Transcript_86971/m.251216 type:complete len:205 (+) Transcript_86971:486-1100(+)
MGDGKMANTTGVSPKTPFLMMAWCWSILVFNGTSSSFVQPPSGDSQSTGFLKPLAFSFCAVSCINSAWPLCTGFRSWKTKTASAPSSANLLCNCAGVRRYWSMPSLYLISLSTWILPPTSQSPALLIISMYGCSPWVIPKVLPARSSLMCSNTSGFDNVATMLPSGAAKAIWSAPWISAFSSLLHALTMGTGIGINSPSTTRCS